MHSVCLRKIIQAQARQAPRAMMQPLTTRDNQKGPFSMASGLAITSWAQTLLPPVLGSSLLYIISKRPYEVLLEFKVGSRLSEIQAVARQALDTSRSRDAVEAIYRRFEEQRFEAFLS